MKDGSVQEHLIEDVTFIKRTTDRISFNTPNKAINLSTTHYLTS